MDKELKKKVTEILKKNITLHSIRGGYGVFSITSFKAIIDAIEKASDEVGYRKVSGEPPILSDEKLQDIWFEYSTASSRRLKIAEAQHEADMRFYNGISD